MKEYLTIAYITFRRNPRFHWFTESLAREMNGRNTGVRIVVVDYYANERSEKVSQFHVAPKPCVWQGPHRLTSRDYFAAANARNTALCLAPDGWIAYVDDLSVLMPGWLNAVSDAMESGYIAQGAYKKVKDLSVRDGKMSYTPFTPGVDTRWWKGSDVCAVPSAPDWLYGCSAAMPVEALLSVNGWEEACDSLGSEDYITGFNLSKKGYEFRYDRRMLTLESEEGHHEEPSLPRFDKGQSPNDKSHKILELAREGKLSNEHVNIREMRHAALKGEPFPIPTKPTHDWYDNQPLSEL